MSVYNHVCAYASGQGEGIEGGIVEGGKMPAWDLQNILSCINTSF